MDRVEERRHGQISQTNNTKCTIFLELAMFSNLHQTYHSRSKPEARIKKKYSEVGNVQDQALLEILVQILTYRWQVE